MACAETQRSRLRWPLFEWLVVDSSHENNGQLGTAGRKSAPEVYA
jgi:hypothetical protein